MREEEKPSSDKALSLPEMERQANLFAAELLMPETLCQAVHEQFNNARFRATARFLEHHIARDLLVSRAAVRWRMKELEFLELTSPPREQGDE